MKLTPQQLRHLVAMKKKRTGRVLPRVPMQRHPLNAQRKYRLRLLHFVAAVRAIILREFKQALPAIVAEGHMAKALMRRDDASAEIDRVIENVRIAIAQAYPDSQLADMAEEMSLSVAQMTQKVIEGQFQSVIGIDLLTSNAALGDFLRLNVKSNVALIKSIPERQFPFLKTLVMRSVSEGATISTIQDAIEERLGSMATNAERIARDQVGKLNGSLTEYRQTQAGIRKYTWRTVGDQRVRDSHAGMEGEVCSWDDPPIVDGEAVNPGQPIECRCFAEPVFDGDSES